MENRDLIDDIVDDWQRERPDIEIPGKGIICRILRLYTLYYRRLESALAKLGLQPNEFSVLVTLRRRGEKAAISQRAILEEVLLTSGGMTNLMRRMTAAGWVTKVGSEADKREVRVSLTDEGRLLVDQAMEIQAQVESQMTSGLGADERQAVEGSLRRMVLLGEG